MWSHQLESWLVKHVVPESHDAGLPVISALSLVFYLTVIVFFPSPVNSRSPFVTMTHDILSQKLRGAEHKMEIIKKIRNWKKKD